MPQESVFTVDQFTQPYYPEISRGGMGKLKHSRKSKHDSIVYKTIAAFQKAFPKGRLWRREPFEGYQAHSGNYVKFGCAGMSDLYGYVPCGGVAIYLEIEIKTGKAVLRDNQRTWRDTTLDNGGIFIEGRENVDETVKNLQEHLQILERKFNLEL